MVGEQVLVIRNWVLGIRYWVIGISVLRVFLGIKKASYFNI
jgi:hypothetical protein